MKLLEICPWEPPASGWTSRVRLLRRVVEERQGTCEILDIGPSRTLERDDCICVYGARDYLRKVQRHARAGYTLHTHVNGEYFRGVLLAVAAAALSRGYAVRSVCTFHAGTQQAFLTGWRRLAMRPLYATLFALSDAIVCNSPNVKLLIAGLTRDDKIHAIPAFSKQYLQYEKQSLPDETEDFVAANPELVSTYLCYREGFFIDVLLDALPGLLQRRPELGLVIVGTGSERERFQQALVAKGLGAAVHLAGDLDHNQFMTLLSRSAVHLRTPTSDGVSATVLEAISLKVPVVASENGTRPDGVLTYRAADSGDMTRKLETALDQREEFVAALQPPMVEDTAATEVDVLFPPTIPGRAPATGRA